MCDQDHHEGKKYDTGPLPIHPQPENSLGRVDEEELERLKLIGEPKDTGKLPLRNQEEEPSPS